MTNIAQVVTKNAQELTTLLEAVKSKMEAIEMLYPLLEQAEKDSIERTELERLIMLCEGNYADEIHTLIGKVGCLAKPRTEGRLVRGADGRYRLDTNDHVFTCGCSIELFIDNSISEDYGWQFGVVEHRERMGGYYFRNYGGDDHRLYPGMLAAVRC